MTSQLALVKIPASAAALSVHQRIAWDVIRSKPGGAYAEEIGLALHVYAGRHSPDGYCEWCGLRGTDVCRSKALSALVVRRRATGKYEPRDPALRAREPMGDIPF